MKSRNGIIAGLILGVGMAMQSVKADLIPAVVSKPIEAFFTSVPQAYMARFILAILTFTIFYAVITQFNILGPKKDSYGPKTGKGIPITLAICLSLIATLAIPNAIALAIYTWYGGIFSLIIFLAPLIGVLVYSYRSKETTTMNHALRCIIFALLAAVLLGKIWISWWLPNATGVQGDFTLNDAIDFAGTIMFILAVVEAIRFFKSLGTGANSRQSTIDSLDTSGSGPDRVTETLDGPDEPRRQAKERQREEEAEKARKKAEDEARRLEELGREMGQLIVHGQNNLERIKDGLKKLNIAMERPDFSKIIPDVKSKIVDSITTDATELKRNEDELTRNGDITSKNFDHLVSDIENQLKGFKNMLNDKTKSRDIAVQNLAMENDAEVKNLLTKIIANYTTQIKLIQDLLTTIQAELKEAKESGNPLSDKHSQLRRAVVPSVDGVKKSTKDISSSIDTLLANPGDPKKRGEEYSKMIGYMNQIGAYIAAIEKLYNEYAQYIKELMTYGRETSTRINQIINKEIYDITKLGIENQALENEIKKIVDEDKKEAEKSNKADDKAVETMARVDGDVKQAEEKGQINKAQLEREYRNLRDLLKTRVPNVEKERIQKRMNDIQEQLNVSADTKDADKDIKNAKKGKLPPKKNVLEDLKRMQENYKVAPNVEKERIQARIYELERIIDQYP